MIAPFDVADYLDSEEIVIPDRIMPRVGLRSKKKAPN